ncbi:putative cytochrome P450 6a14 [Blattella germanica]|nr:putative cytochrome P450 6a14 [Blattella germanica]
MLEVFNSAFLLLGGLVLASVYLYYHLAFTYWKKKGVATPKPIIPFGNFMRAFLPNSNPQLEVLKFYSEFEGVKVIGLYRFSKPALMLKDPDVIKEVLVKDFDHFYGRGIQINEKYEPLQGHLFALSGPKWRNLRMKLTPTFTSGKMKMMFPNLVETGKELTAYLKAPAEKQEVLEIKDILARYSTDIIASCAFGIQCNCFKNPDSEFRVWGRKIFAPSFRSTFARLVSLLAPKLFPLLKLSIVPKDVSNYFRKMVRETVEYREKHDVHRNDFLQLLIQLKNKTLGGVEEDHLIKMPTGALDEVTMDVMAAQAFVFFLAGFETSSTTMTFCLYELAVNPDIQDRLREEIDTMLENNKGQLEYDAIMGMEYLDKVIHETLRKYPPVTLLTRECAKTTPLRGTDIVVDKGTLMFLPIYALHHDPKYFPEPERFDPERFSEEEKQNRPHYCYLPFGEGPRICIVGLISVLSKYEVHVSEKTPVPLEFDSKSLVLAPVGGLWLKIKERNEKYCTRL